MADLCGAAGMRMPTIAPHIQKALREFIPDYLTVANPVDNGAVAIRAGHGPKILDLLLDDPNTDLIICPITGAFPPMSDMLAQELVDGWKSGKKPIVAIWGSPVLDDPAYRTLVEGRLPLFRSFRNAVNAVKAYLDYNRFADVYESPFARPATTLQVDPQLLAAHGALNERDSKALLAQAGIGVTREAVCTTANDAQRFAREIDYPLAMKISSADIPHKSEAGLVQLHVASDEQVAQTFSELMERARRQHPRATIDGVLVQEMVTDGVETLVGISRDPILGPTVVFGLGGIFVEVMKDVAMRTVPLTRGDAEAMVHEIKGFPILDGARGRARADVPALIDAICKVAAFAQAAGDRLQELDINPLMVLPAGRGVKAADALVVLK